MKVYEKYSLLLDGRADLDVTAFLSTDHSLEGFARVTPAGGNTSTVSAALLVILVVFQV